MGAIASALVRAIQLSWKSAVFTARATIIANRVITPIKNFLSPLAKASLAKLKKVRDWFKKPVNDTSVIKQWSSRFRDIGTSFVDSGVIRKLPVIAISNNQAPARIAAAHIMNFKSHALNALSAGTIAYMLYDVFRDQSVEDVIALATELHDDGTITEDELMAVTGIFMTQEALEKGEFPSGTSEENLLQIKDWADSLYSDKSNKALTDTSEIIDVDVVGKGSAQGVGDLLKQMSSDISFLQSVFGGSKKVSIERALLMHKLLSDPVYLQKLKDVADALK